MSDYRLRKDLGEKAREVVSQFGWDKIAEKEPVIISVWLR